MTQFINIQSESDEERSQAYKTMLEKLDADNLELICKWKNLDWAEELSFTRSALSIRVESETIPTPGTPACTWDHATFAVSRNIREEVAYTEDDAELMEQLLDNPVVLRALRASILMSIMDRE